MEKAKAFSIESFEIFKNDKQSLDIALKCRSNITYETFDLSIKDIYLLHNFVPDISASMLVCNCLKEIVFKNIIKPITKVQEYLKDYDSQQYYRLFEITHHEYIRDNILIYFDEQEIQHFKDELIKQLEILKS